jgi:hypothetical protein
MKSFKFLKGTLNDTHIDYRLVSWYDITLDRYQFRIQTHLSRPEIAGELQDINRHYMRMWDDDMNRTRLLSLLHTKFQSAVNVINRDELLRNGGYI